MSKKPKEYTLLDYSRAEHGGGRPGGRRRRGDEVPDGVGGHLPQLSLAPLLQPLEELSPRELRETVVPKILRKNTTCQYHPCISFSIH